MPVAISGLIMLIILLIAGNSYLDTTERLKNQAKSDFKESWITETPTPTPEDVGSRYFIPTPTLDPDPIVNCESNLCDGGKRRKSECDKSTCCQIGDKWYFYTSKEKCKQDQDAYWASFHKGNYYSPNYTYTPYTPIYTYTPAPFLTYPPLPTPTPTLSPEEVQASINQLNAENDRLRRECISRVKEKYNPQLIQYGCPLMGQEGRGSSSVCDALKYYWEKEVEECNKKYPHY